jgi:hypothetical protein
MVTTATEIVEAVAGDFNAPGIYPGIKRSVYDCIDAMNQSTLKAFKKNPLAWSQGWPRKETDSFLFGHLFESMLFDDVNAWERDFAVLDDNTKDALLKAANERQAKPSKVFSKALKEFKDWKLERLREGRGIVDIDMVCEASLASRRAKRDPNIRGLLKNGGDAQVAVVWRDPDTDLLCKGLIDYVPTGLASLVDVKTSRELNDATRTAAPYKFARAVRNYGYNVQAAYYLDGWNAAIEQAGLDESPRNSWLFVVAGNAQPWPAGAWRLGEEEIDRGRMEYKAGLHEWKMCHETDHFPGLTTEDEWPELPTPFER